MNLCIIPARGGSKRIPKKNIKKFCGKPLIYYSIETALNSKLFDKVVVSTDSEEIAEVSKKYGAEILYRPKELADDYAGSDEVFDHAINELNKNNEFKFACMIYATAPFLQEKYLKEGFEKLKNSDACYSFSATSFEYPIWRSFRIKNDRCEMFWPENYSKRSQDLEEAYHDAGQFYWRKLNCKSDEIFFSKNSIPIIIPRYLVQDIDTMEDFIRAEMMFKVVCDNNEFNKWNDLKQKLNSSYKNINFVNGNIYWVAIGKNIRNESFGKGDKFLRPVLVFKKLSHNYFLGIPLTSKEKQGKYYFEFEFKNKKSYAMFNQIRVFSSKRVIKYMGKISRKEFTILKNKFVEFITT